MRSLIIATALASVCCLAAAEPASQADSVGEQVASKGLMSRLEGVRQNMSSVASELVVNAMGFLGVRYKYGGNDLEDGVDCSGFVRAIYEQTLGMVLPRRAAEQASATQTISQDELKPGDLVFFNTMRSAFSHVGIYIGDNKFIHAPRSGEQVRVEDMRQSYWVKRFNGARRVEAGAGSIPLPLPR